jgi:hypothetical protein
MKKKPRTIALLPGTPKLSFLSARVAVFHLWRYWVTNHTRHFLGVHIDGTISGYIISLNFLFIVHNHVRPRGRSNGP